MELNTLGMKEVVKKPSTAATRESKPLLSASEHFLSAAPVQVQRKNELSQPGDALEKEADMTADKIMTKSEQGASSHSTGANTANASTATIPQSISGASGGNAMNSSTREKME